MKEKIEKYCRYCEHAQSLSDEGEMLCEKNGVVKSEYHCRHFIYDPLKRVPKRKEEPVLEYVEV